MMQRTALSQLLCRRLMSSGGTRRRVVHVPGQTKVRDFPLIYPDFLPSPVWNRRLASYEKLQRADMLERRMSIDIPEFYVDREFGRLSYRQSSSMDSHNQLYIDSSFGVLAMPYDEFDINLTDINEVEMEKIGIAEEVKHLSPGTFSDPAFPVRGIVHGPNSRLMVPLTFQRSRKPDSPVINVWCLIDTGSPFTCLSVKTLEAFFGAGNVVDGMYYPFAIQDQSTRIECQVSRVGTHFEHVNIMGIDSLRKLKLNLDIDWDKDTFELIKK